jgi:small subunit ribosomal protein S14
MPNLIERDKRKRNRYLELFQRRNALKKVLKDKTQDMSHRYKAQIELNSLAKDSMRIRLSNRCSLTGRTHSVSNSFRMSRIKLRELISIGLINGAKKSSW